MGSGIVHRRAVLSSHIFNQVFHGFVACADCCWTKGVPEVASGAARQGLLRVAVPVESVT